MKSGTKRNISLGAAIAICAAAFIIKRGFSIWKSPLAGKTDPVSRVQSLIRLDDKDIATRRYMIYFMIPLWIGAGLLDWYWHKKTKIEKTAGPKESLIHALMMVETGIPVTAALLFEVNAGVLLMMVAAFFLHELTAAWDVAYAIDRRDVKPREQHTHSFLELLPFCAVSFMIVLHWDQFGALFGVNDEKPDFRIRWKKAPIPPAYIAAILSAVALGIGVPYAEEYIRCKRAEQEGLTGTEIPAYVKERVEERGYKDVQD